MLQKSFSGDERNFLGLLMRFVCGDVRVLIVSYKNDHGPSRCRYRALQWQRFLKICFREICGVVRFSTFATISALNGHAAMSDLSPLCAAQRTLTGPCVLVFYVSLNDASQALTRAD